MLGAQDYCGMSNIEEKFERKQLRHFSSMILSLILVQSQILNSLSWQEPQPIKRKYSIMHCCRFFIF